MLSPEQERKIKRLANVVDNGIIGILPELEEIQKKIDNLVFEKGEKGDKGERGERGENGKDGRDGRDGKDGIDGKDGRDGIDGKDGEMGVIDEATIGYLENEIKRVEEVANKSKYTRDGIGVVIRGLVAGTNVTIDSSNMEYPVVSASGGGISDGDKGDITVSGSGTVFTIDDDTIGLDELSATGTPDSTKFLRGDNTWAVPAGGGGSVTKGIAEVDFGAVTQNNDIATVMVSDASITATSYPSVTMYAVATTDHDPDDYMAEELSAYVTNVSAGVGFDISVRAPNLSWGKYKVTYMY